MIHAGVTVITLIYQESSYTTRRKETEVNLWCFSYMDFQNSGFPGDINWNIFLPWAFGKYSIHNAMSGGNFQISFFEIIALNAVTYNPYNGNRHGP